MAQPHHATRPEDKVPLIQRLGVGVGGFPLLTGGMAVQMLAQPVYQIFLGMNPALFGLAMTIPRIWDAFTDPVMGAVSDNFRSRWGRRRPFIFVGALLMVLTYSLIWFVPRGMGDLGMFLWLVVSSILFFTAYTVFSVPLGSLTYEMTPDYHERTRFMGFWAFFTTAGNFFINWYPPATQWGGFGDPLTGSRWVGLGISILIFGVLGVLPAIFGRERFYATSSKQEKIGFFSAIKQAASSRAMLLLIGVILSLNFCSTIAASLAQYIIIYYVKGGDIPAGIVLNAMNGTVFCIVMFAAIPPITWLGTRFGKRHAMQVVLGLAVVGGLWKLLIYTPKMPYLLLLDGVVSGPIWVALSILLPSMMADLCDDDEFKHGQRREGVINAVFAWITKVGLSFTFLFSGVALVLSGFDSKLPMQSEDTLTAMRFFFTASSILAPALAMLCMKFYPITEQYAYDIRAQLEARRGIV